MRRALALVLLLSLCGAGCGSPSRVVRAAASPSPSPGAGVSASPSEAAVSTAGPRPVEGKVMLGAYLELKNMTLTESLALRRSQLGRGMRILHLYFNWTDGLVDPIGVVPDGCIPMLSWSPLPSYASVTDGSQDALIRRQASAIAAYGKPLFLRWGWEMNGNWFPWSGAKNSSRGTGYIAAWRHIHDIFAEEGATNVAWVWSPNYFSQPAQAWNDMTKYYPGDAYVDWVGTSGYSYGRELPEYLFGRTYRTYASRKPVMISEVGVSESGGTTRPDWIRALRVWIVAHPGIDALVWFDTDTYKGTNWRLDTTAAAMAAFKELADDPHFAG
jgi:hypothetical protein